jgi:queuine tRNA-ribosyltransferase
VKSGEILAQVMLSWHNLAFYQALTAAMRAAIEAGRFAAFRAAFHAELRPAEGEEGADRPGD